MLRELFGSRRNARSFWFVNSFVLIVGPLLAFAYGVGIFVKVGVPWWVGLIALIFSCTLVTRVRIVDAERVSITKLWVCLPYRHRTHAVVEFQASRDADFSDVPDEIVLVGPGRNNVWFYCKRATEVAARLNEALLRQRMPQAEVVSSGRRAD